MILLEEVAEILLEGQAVHVFTENGDDWYYGYAEGFKESEVPIVEVVGIYADVDNVNGEDMDMLEIVVKAEEKGNDTV